MRTSGRWLAASLAALVLLASPLWTERAATFLPPFSPPAPVLFSLDSGAPVLLSRVYANAARDDEFVEVASRSAESIDLAGWSLTDREATATFPRDSMLPPGGRIVITTNATSYAEDVLMPADFAFRTGDARLMEGEVPRLADAGDEVLLLDPFGSTVDVYAWGDSDYLGPGWSGRAAERMGRGEIAIRNSDSGGWHDGDVAEDWEGLRSHRLGQSSLDLESFETTGPATAVLSPDDGDGALLRFLGAAELSIDVGVYTLTSERIGSVLAAAAGRGVAVRILLDGSPVGGIEDEERRIVGSLLTAGAEVRFLSGGIDVVKRYRYYHAKYAIVDARSAWIGSENFGDAGFPAARAGNRGWSLLLDDEAIANALREVFELDFDSRRRDSIPALVPLHEPLPPTPSISPSSRVTASVGAARLVIAPDATMDPGGPLGLFASAHERLSIEAFYFDEMWRNDTNPFLEAAFDAARRGVSVRILLDGSWSSVGDAGSNDDVAERLNSRARKERVSLEARLLEPRGSIERLHNKGAIVDGRQVLVSSMNWALGSATENREVGLIVEDSNLARMFEASFDADWEGRPTSGVDAWRLDDPVGLVALYALVAVASAVSLRKLRARNKDIKPPARVRTRASFGAHLRGRRREVRLLPAELVAQPRARTGGRPGARRGRKETRGRVRGPEGN